MPAYSGAFPTSGGAHRTLAPAFPTPRAGQSPTCGCPRPRWSRRCTRGTERSCSPPAPAAPAGRGGGGRHTGGVSAAIAGGGGGWGGVLPSGSGRQVLWWAPGSRPGSPSPVRDHRHHHQKRRKKIRRRQNNALVQMKLNSIQHGSSKAPAGASLRYKSNVFFPSSRTDLDVQTLQHRHAEGGRLSCSRLRPERSHNVTLLLDNFLGSLKLGGWG